MVYVDNFQAHFGRMIMCHMIADSHQELIDMIELIGVNRKWIQDEGTSKEHFDICASKKRLAIKNGAKEINMRELVTIINDRDYEKYLNPESMIEYQLSLFG